MSDNDRSRREPTHEPDAFAALLHARVREVYRDETLWALDKPAGVLSHPNPPARRAANALLRCDYDFEAEAYRAGLAGASNRVARLFLIHRLDQDTSGLILSAFDESAAASLKQALAQRQVHKQYLALVLGIPRAKEGLWRDCLQKRSRRGRAEVAVVKGRPNAVTHFRRLDVYEAADASLLELSPETGRTHQLRVQAAARGLPIAGDDRYGDFVANRRAIRLLGLRRMFLHAHGLDLRHPRTGEMTRLTVDFDESLAAAVERAARLRECLRIGKTDRRRT